MRIAAFGVASLLLIAPAAAQDKATIQKHNDNFTAAFAKGDFAAIGSMYTEDAYVLPPGGPMISGRAQIQAFWTTAAEGIAKVTLTVVDVKPLGDAAAREIGTFALTTKSSPPQEIAGKYVVVWQKVGSDWKLSTDIWNANK